MQPNSVTDGTPDELASQAPGPTIQQRLYPFLLIIISTALYGNTIFNEYVLDDGLVITDNKLTQSGINGIPDILTKDTFFGALGPTVEVAGGRYRPLSVVTFALEQELFKGNPYISHAINVVLFGCTVLLLFSFLKNSILKEREELAFLAALIFTVHPIHTEVVANIKSRDELLSLLFLLMALMLAFRYHMREKKILYLVASAIFYCLALFSKENGIAFLAVIPLFLYFFTSARPKSIPLLLVPYVVVALLYIVVRFSVTGAAEGTITEVMNAPYVYATFVQKYATIILVLGKYLWLLLFPHPLTYDYSYNQIPYVDFANLLVWCSLLLHLGLLLWAVLGWRSRSVFSFAILFYFITVSLVSNIVVDIGAPMGERLLYQPSVGFCIFAAAGINRAYERVKTSKGERNIAATLLVVVMILGAYKTIIRNGDWKNNETLLLRDLEVSPNSASANRRAAMALIKLSEQDSTRGGKEAYLRRAILVLEKSVKIHPTYGDGYLGLGVVYSRLDEVESAEEAWTRARKLNANNYLAPDYENYLKVAYFNKGTRLGVEGHYNDALVCLLKSIHYGPDNPDAWYYLGGAYISLGQREKAKEAWQKVLTLKPDYQLAIDRLKELNGK
jgi:tetratricopeptide (TPR) repeat protein